ncbi:hypothetical protein BKA70DRAFT_1240506 [Coprinopsis sp. MPI-PUGE-AT-0042]|nr:hypothetical protein BKA70DRAFT_1240506 [Coprinopsis sp. MPI-PUGE-AT-0042]
MASSSSIPPVMPLTLPSKRLGIGLVSGRDFCPSALHVPTPTIRKRLAWHQEAGLDPSPSTPSGPTPSSTSHSISEEHAGSARHVTAPEEPSASIGDVVAPQRKLPSPDNRGDQAGQRAKQIGDYRASQQASFNALQLTSTDREKQCWASRLQQPPTRKCKVLIWAPDPQNPGVLKKAKGEPDDLWDFTDNQKWYEPVQDAWHCCVDLAPNEMTDEDHHLMEDLYGSTSAQSRSHGIPRDTMGRSFGSVPSPLPDMKRTRLAEQFIQTLSKFYGFLPPASAPSG